MKQSSRQSFVSHMREELVRVGMSGGLRISKRPREETFLAGFPWVRLDPPSPDEPSLWIRKDVYHQMLQETLEELLARARACFGPSIPPELLQVLLPSLKKELYRKVVAEVRETGSTKDPPSKETFSFYRARLLQGVLSHIEQKRLKASQRLQEIWREIVGDFLARESLLVRVDPEKQVAYIRCADGHIGFEISRRSELAQHLSKRLGVPIRKLRSVW
ncbi:DUF721 domain-containing protein [Candidatus Methylacidithermus pantelleriae]|uniref:Uncharacterized protein n=1 Tax=Candidatus Methylacidithermus pantelleriae TaxID=2744239 RepID=A0A8J2BKW8_9BACT|nr:DciA family protein [Candidatus Methylacidithermus pantelleriae]CAF0694646.1 hypothetical protein MPNT_170021 [Candidatus Methylacidithermus pantelleriae]